MTDTFINLSGADLHALVAALRSRRVAAPYSDLQLTRVVSSGVARSVADGLIDFASLGFTSEQIIAVLELLEPRLLLSAMAIHESLLGSGPATLMARPYDLNVDGVVDAKDLMVIQDAVAGAIDIEKNSGCSWR